MKNLSKHLRRAGITLVLILVGIQFVPAGRTNPPVRSQVQAPDEIEPILRRACYDCHSNETRWTWYSYVAPASWFVVRHVNHGRGDLNFSEWPAFDLEAEEHAFKDIEEQIRKGEMPLRSYTWLHRDAKLSADERDALLRWARSQR
jgi:hypothetical protein